MRSCIACRGLCGLAWCQIHHLSTPTGGVTVAVNMTNNQQPTIIFGELVPQNVQDFLGWDYLTIQKYGPTECSRFFGVGLSYHTKIYYHEKLLESRIFCVQDHPFTKTRQK